MNTHEKEDFSRLAELIAERVSQNLHPQLIANSEPEYLDVNEAAKFLKVRQQTVYHNLYKIPHLKRGKLYFKKSDLIDYLEAGRQKIDVDYKKQAAQILAGKKGGGR